MYVDADDDKLYTTTRTLTTYGKNRHIYSPVLLDDGITLGRNKPVVCAAEIVQIVTIYNLIHLRRTKATSELSLNIHDKIFDQIRSVLPVLPPTTISCQLARK